MTYTCTPKGVCAKKITVELDEENKITDITFVGGCKGNAQAVRRLLLGKSVDELTALNDVVCGYKETSCVAEIAKYLISVL